MKADAYRVLERAVEEALSGYLRNRVNKHVTRARWTYEFDGVVSPYSEEQIIGIVVDEATDAIMGRVCEWFSFDQEPEVHQIGEQDNTANKERERILDLFRRVRDEDPAAYAAATWAIFTIHEDEEG